MAIAKKKTQARKSNAQSTASVKSQRTAKKAAKKTASRKPAAAPKQHDVAKAVGKAFRPAEKIGGKVLSAVWLGSMYVVGMYTGPIDKPMQWKRGKEVAVSGLTRYFKGGSVIRHHGGKGNLGVDTLKGQKSKPMDKVWLTDQGLAFIQARAIGTGDIATPASMIHAAIAAIKTGKVDEKVLGKLKMEAN